jgi:hypothetical protein
MTTPLCVVCDGPVPEPSNDPVCPNCWLDGRALYGPPWSREWRESVELARENHRRAMPTAWDRVRRRRGHAMSNAFRPDKRRPK